ncbi:hypothetical protein Droror1_Dr00012570 [Drosera rotundifolia]
MGCGGSKLSLDHESIPQRFRPILCLRLDELRRRRHPAAVTGDATLSKKELLARNESEEDGGSRSSQSTQAPLKLKTTAEDDHEPNEGPDAEALQPQEETKAGEMSCKDEGQKKGLEMDQMGEKRRENEGKKVDGEEDEHESSEDDAIFASPGSPSFRVYCCHDHDLSDDNQDHEKGDEGHDDAEVHVKEESHHPEESINSNKISGEKPANSRGGRRIRRLKKCVITPKGGAKNLWNIRGCYTHQSPDSAQLLEKTAA